MERMLLSVFLSFACVAAWADSPRVARRKPLTANVGVVSVGLDTYWKQCPGLLEDMLKKEGRFADRIAAEKKFFSLSVFFFAIGVRTQAKAPLR